MARDEGFAIADVSTSTLDDAKVRALVRLLNNDAATIAIALIVREAVLLSSWREGERLRPPDCAPAWIPEPDIKAATDSLIAVALLDRSGRIPQKSWKRWFGEAYDRREQTRARWRRSKKPADPSTEVSEASAPTPRGIRADSTVPSVRPTDRQSVRPSARAHPRARSNGLTPIGGSGRDDRRERISRAQATLDDPRSSDTMKALAASELERLGVIVGESVG